VIRRIHVKYSIAASADMEDTIARVHRIHHMNCPLYRTLHNAIAITTEYNLTSVD
jgi:uncharacterized OsmC-like protein